VTFVTGPRGLPPACRLLAFRVQYEWRGEGSVPHCAHEQEGWRQAIQALRSDRVETLGLAGALRDALQAFQARSGIQAELSVAGQEPDLTAEEAQALFRIAEAALSNVERHAVARQVSVRLAYGADRIDLVIGDDGRGFNPLAVEPGRYGLTGMRERAAMVGATLEVNSHPGGGTEIWCSLKG
jgi:signal transduction histidine kinase